jgi:predicted DsbA family dithiol-disulfide isomerase
MTQQIKIDFASDVACPWCIVGLGGLQEALARTTEVIRADITFQPFELNPKMPADGQNIVEHITEKYGSTAEESKANRAMIRARAADVGFDFNMHDDSRIYNTFDAHRLLHWAHEMSRQTELKLALFKANFTDGANVSQHDVLVAAAVSAGLDGEKAREVLSSGRYTEEVRAAEQLWLSRGIQSVPAIVVNETWLISGGQPADAYERILREIAADLTRA